MIIHSIHQPVSAKNFIEPIAQALSSNGYQSELWTQRYTGQENHLSSIKCIPVKLLPCSLSWKPWVLVYRWLSWYTALRLRKPRAVHCHQMGASVIPLSAAFFARVPIRIYHNHGLPYLGHRGVLRLVLKSIERMNVFFSTFTIMVSHGNQREAIRDKLVSPSKSTVLGKGSAIGLDLAQWPLELFNAQSRQVARDKLGILTDDFVVLYVGRPFKRKGFKDLLDAWSISKLGDNGGKLIMAGFNKADVIREGYTLPKGTMPLGMRTDMRDLYSACDIVCLPSWHEGFPYALLEAAAAGRPSIGTRIPGITCAIDDRVTGIIVPPQDPPALANALRELRFNSEMCCNYGKNARGRVEAHFRRDSLTLLYVKLYESLFPATNIARAT